MPDVTVSANVDTMLRAANNAAIRSAIGLGQTDAPTFLSVTISGDGRKFYLENGDLATGRFGSTYWKTGELVPMLLRASGALGWSSANSQPLLSGDTFLYRDGAEGILAQRNGTNAQAFRVYNTYPGTTANEWFEINWQPTGTNAVKIGTAHAGTGAARPIDFVTGGVVRMSIGASGTAIFSGAARFDSFFYIGAANAVSLQSGGSATGVLLLQNGVTNNFGRIQLGGTDNTFPAIKRNGTGIDIVLANDSGFAPISSLYQRFGSGSPESVVTAPTGATYHRTDGGSGSSYYVKESGSGATGWVGK